MKLVGRIYLVGPRGAQYHDLCGNQIVASGESWPPRHRRGHRAGSLTDRFSQVHPTYWLVEIGDRGPQWRHPNAA